MKCSKCGAEFNSAFCPSCGSPRPPVEPLTIDQLTKSRKNPRGVWAFVISLFTLFGANSAWRYETHWVDALFLIISIILTVSAFKEAKEQDLKRGLTITALILCCISAMLLLPVLIGDLSGNNENSSSSDNAITKASVATNTATSSSVPTPSPTPSPTATPVFSVVYEVGQYKVGLDIAAGEYMAIAADGFGYICVSADSNQSDITFNDVFETNTVFTVYDGEYLELSGCNAVLADEFYAVYTIDKNKDGVMLKVGHDIIAGEYKLEATDGMGYYCIYKDTRHARIVANDIFETTSFVTVKEGQYLILSHCKIISSPVEATPTPHVDQSAVKTSEPKNASTQTSKPLTPPGVPDSAPTSAPSETTSGW